MGKTENDFSQFPHLQNTSNNRLDPVEAVRLKVSGPQHDAGPGVKSSVTGSYVHHGDTLAASCACF